ncbi:MAG TPA: two-component regulator propeller domain-containing protein [Bacteroidia bacterium]|nr:two-component regulator propeller domain-containing protein [Bacteroidia bacterium]
MCCRFLSRVFFFSVLLNLFPFLPVRAQPLVVPGGFHHIAVKDGLPSSEVYKIFQDSKGYIWMLTDAGVCRYNGYVYSSFTSQDGLTDNTVFRIAEDNTGRIWLQGFSGALNYYEDGAFHQVPADDSLRKVYLQGQRTGYCMALDRYNGVTIGGLYTRQCYRVSPADGYTHLQIDSGEGPRWVRRKTWVNEEGNIISYACDSFLVEDRGVFYLNHKRILVNFEPTIDNTTNNRICYSSKGLLYYSFGEWLYCIHPDGNVGKVRMSSMITGIDEDKEGNIWVSLDRNGTFRFGNGDLSGKRTCYLPGKTVSSVLEDNEGAFWFSTVGQGVFYLPEINFHYLTRQEGLPGNAVLSSCALGADKVVFGFPETELVMIRSCGNDSFPFKSRRIAPGNYLGYEVLLPMHDSILVNDSGMRVLDSDLNTVSFHRPYGHCKGGAISPVDGSAVMFSHSMLFWVQRTGAVDFSMLVPLRFTCVCGSKDGTFWFGSLQGLWRSRGRSVYPMTDSVPEINMRIDKLQEDKAGNLWIATRGEGLFVLSGRKVIHFTEESGLASNSCRTLCVDSMQNVWVGTNRGLTRISGFDPVTGHAVLRSFNSTNGLLSDEVTSLVFNCGKIWIGSYEGICWVDPDLLDGGNYSPPVYIKKILYGDSSISVKGIPEFAFGENAVRIFLEGLYFRDTKHLQYEYRLSGVDDDWIVTSNTEISFSGLAPGEYTLQVYAVSPNNVVSKTPAVFSFRVLPPYWMKWWFITFEVLLLAAVIYFVVSYRLKKQRQREQEKNETEKRIAELRLIALRSQMNPHFIFNAINSIQHFVLQNDSEQAYTYLSKFSRLIRLVLDQSQSEKITLAQELSILRLYVELEQLRFERPFEFFLDVDPVLLDSNICIQGMLVQPFVENAIWHGLIPKKEGNAYVKVVFRKENSFLCISIEDNGVGRSQSTKAGEENVGRKKSYGMMITRERLSLSEKNPSGQPRFIITDLVDENGKPAGTRVEIRVELDEDDF